MAAYARPGKAGFRQAGINPQGLSKESNSLPAFSLPGHGHPQVVEGLLIAGVELDGFSKWTMAPAPSLFGQGHPRLLCASGKFGLEAQGLLKWAIPSSVFPCVASTTPACCGSDGCLWSLPGYAQRAGCCSASRIPEFWPPPGERRGPQPLKGQHHPAHDRRIRDRYPMAIMRNRPTKGT